MTHVLVFTLTLLAEICWTMYYKEVALDRAFRAASWSSMIVLCGGLTVFEYAHNLSYLLDSFAASFLGVIIAMRWKKVYTWWVSNDHDCI